MIQLLKRKEATQNKNLVASMITKVQQAFYDEDLLQSYKEDQEEEVFWEYYDYLKQEVVECPTFFKIIGIRHHELETFTHQLELRLKSLFEVLGVTKFLVLSHLKLDFFGQGDSDYPPLANAHRLLKEITHSSSYNEAFAFGLEDLAYFVEILFWITRCDPEVAEYIYIFDTDEKLCFNICKYGNVHLVEFREERLTKERLNALSWEIIDGWESDPFTEEGSIQGRVLKLKD